MEEKPNGVEDAIEEVEETESVSGDSFIDDLSDEDVELASEEGGSQLEGPLTEEEIEELVAELLEVESKAAEAQEALEKESLEKVEQEVREELAERLHGDDLERAVADEMATLREEWEESLDELETESAQLLEQLDGAGVDLPSIYKWIESKAPGGCCTEAWKKRTHWVGAEITSDAVESIKDAEKHLQTLRPVRRRHGKVLEEGAGGYLGKKVAVNDGGKGLTDNAEADWTSFNKLFSNQSSKEGISFGSEQWASVYLASTPQQAAAMGLKFPGVEEVEEIDEIDDDPSDPFVADAIAHEKELDLSEEQRKRYRKVKEQDDMSVDQRLQLHLKCRRRRKRSKQGNTGKTCEVDSSMNFGTQSSAEGSNDPTEGASDDNGRVPNEDIKARFVAGGRPLETIKGENNSSETLMHLSSETSHGSKRSRDGEEVEIDAKRSRMDLLDSEDKTQTLRNGCDLIGRDDTVVDSQPIAQNCGCIDSEISPENMYKKFQCTACGKGMNVIHQHPLLKVVVCEDCKSAVEAKMNAKDSDLSESYCAWCGSSNELINCRSCKSLFCMSCIKRNIGVEYSSQAKKSGWQCCCCSPNLLHQLSLELEKALGSEDSTSSSSDTDTYNSDDDTGVSISSKKNKKIRRILDDTELGEETKRKIAMEKERQERLKSLKAQFSGIPMMNLSTCNDLPEGASTEVLGDSSTGFIVNVVRERGEDAVRIPPSISAKLKTHQVAGIRFMWENIIQSIRNVKAGDKGLGCILAHTMGLGKTFQVIAFLYTAMRSVDLGMKSALIVAPVNVLHNWRQEFRKWEPKEFKPLRVYMLEDKPRERRAELLTKWRTKGGVFLIGYTAFRNLSLGKNVKDRQAAKEICYALQEGPDILVCDEAHMIKNTRADTTQALKQVKCQRRIALTGSPLQNNLMEYYCMVDFVREGFLGSMHEFRNRFQNPIENGQHANSTAEDVTIMNQRSHILYEQLKGFVQRMDMSVVKKDLPPKTVFVIAVKLSSLQRKLYKMFLDVHGFNKASCEGIRKKSFFAGYQALAQICNHPWILQLMKEREYAKREDTVENCLPDGSTSDENTDSNGVIAEKGKAKNEINIKKNSNSFFLEGWWSDLLKSAKHQEIDYSGKMVLLLDILTMCTEMGDKALVFSQSLPTLDLIESYLLKLPRQGKRGKLWRRGKDWYRIDGKTEGSERQKLVDAFNDPQNRRVKCTLISTRAGALGINLFAANRVIIVDGSWNPTHDLQAIYRAWRYGQTKPVYAYRLMAHGTMEEKIYKRQVKKEGLAARVVDRQQVHRSMSKEEILHFFDFGDEENLDMLPGFAEGEGNVLDTNIGTKAENKLKQNSSDCPESCSSDKLMEVLLNRHRLRWIMNYHEHETLLQENEEEKLTKEEQEMAWEVYKKSMVDWQEVRRVPADESTFQQKENVPNTQSFEYEKTSVSEPLINVRTRVPVRKCTNVSHLLTLRSQGIKVGCSTVCGECAEEISWEDLNRDS